LEELEAALRRSPRQRALEFIADENGFERDAVLAAEMPDGFGPVAALIRMERGFRTMTGELQPKAGPAPPRAAPSPTP
jgi:hypothetical protein